MKKNYEDGWTSNPHILKEEKIREYLQRVADIYVEKYNEFRRSKINFLFRSKRKVSKRKISKRKVSKRKVSGLKKKGLRSQKERSQRERSQREKSPKEENRKCHLKRSLHISSDSTVGSAHDC